MSVSDREFEDLKHSVNKLANIITGGDDPSRGISVQLDRLIQLAEQSKAREARILQFALIGVGSGATGFVSLIVGIVVFWLTKGR